MQVVAGMKRCGRRPTHLQRSLQSRCSLGTVCDMAERLEPDSSLIGDWGRVHDDPRAISTVAEFVGPDYALVYHGPEPEDGYMVSISFLQSSTDGYLDCFKVTVEAGPEAQPLNAATLSRLRLGGLIQRARTDLAALVQWSDPEAVALLEQRRRGWRQDTRAHEIDFYAWILENVERIQAKTQRYTGAIRAEIVRMVRAGEWPDDWPTVDAANLSGNTIRTWKTRAEQRAAAAEKGQK